MAGGDNGLSECIIMAFTTESEENHEKLQSV